MTQNNGLGSVGGPNGTIKNISLGAPSTAAEGILAVPNATGDGYWALTWTPGTNQILAYEFGEDGPKNQGLPTVSTLPAGYFDSVGWGTLQVFFGADSTRIVQMEDLKGDWLANAVGENGKLRVFNFNAETGQFGLQYEWFVGTAHRAGGGYSADFSPSGDYVYANTLYGPPGTIYRYKLAGAVDSAAVKASEEIVGQSVAWGGMVRKGPDGKIYAADEVGQFLGVVNSPDAEDIADVGWNNKGVVLPAGSTSRYGFPQFVTGCPSGKLTTEKTVTSDGTFTEGGLLEYSFLVKNTGNVPLTEVQVTDFAFTGTGIRPTPSCPGGLPIARMAPGESITCSAQYVLTQQDVDTGFVENQACAVGLDPDGTETECLADKTEFLLTQSPSLSLVKTSSPNTPTEFRAGENITYSFRVFNTGNVTLTNLNVVETAWSGELPLDPVTCQSTVLAPAAETNCSVTYTLAQADIDRNVLENTAKVTAITPGAISVESAPDNAMTPGIQSPALSMEKVATPVKAFAAGADIQYTFVVKNTGNVTLSDLSIDELNFSGNGAVSQTRCDLQTLAPNGSTLCHATYEVLQEDFDGVGDLVNEANARGTTPSNTQVESSTDSATVELIRSADVVVTKTADRSSVRQASDVIEYSFLVQNRGNVTASDVQVQEDIFNGLNRVQPVPVCPETMLGPGEEMVCTAQYVISPEDIKNLDFITNSAFVQSRTVLGPADSELSEVQVEVPRDSGTPPTTGDPDNPDNPEDSSDAKLEATGAAGDTTMTELAITVGLISFGLLFCLLRAHRRLSLRDR